MKTLVLSSSSFSWATSSLFNTPRRLCLLLALLFFASCKVLSFPLWSALLSPAVGPLLSFFCVCSRLSFSPFFL